MDEVTKLAKATDLSLKRKRTMVRDLSQRRKLKIRRPLQASSVLRYRYAIRRHPPPIPAILPFEDSRKPAGMQDSRTAGFEARQPGSLQDCRIRGFQDSNVLRDPIRVSIPR